LGREFNNELINYANYAIRSLKNERIRETIMDRVMETNREVHEPLPEVEVDNTDKPWFDDPEGIAVPWEEKYGKDRSE